MIQVSVLTRLLDTWRRLRYTASQNSLVMHRYLPSLCRWRRLGHVVEGSLSRTCRARTFLRCNLEIVDTSARRRVMADWTHVTIPKRWRLPSIIQDHRGIAVLAIDDLVCKRRLKRYISFLLGQTMITPVCECLNTKKHSYQHVSWGTARSFAHERSIGRVFDLTVRSSPASTFERSERMPQLSLLFHNRTSWDRRARRGIRLTLTLR